MEINIEIKHCPYCGKTKSKKEFHKNRSKSGGLACGCKVCMNYRKKDLKPRYNKYLNNARRKGISFNISIEEFNKLTKEVCIYCGGFSSEFNGINYTGIDRVNSKKGYNTKNCVSCCSVCNFMKRRMSQNQFLGHIERIYYNFHNNLERGSR